MYLYIYCEWLDSELVFKYLPRAKFVTKATSNNYKVVFSSFMEDISEEMMHGGCLAEACHGEVLHGVLYHISEEDLEKLDKLTRVEYGRYVQKHFEVFGADGKTYHAVAHSIKNPKGKSKPSKEYMDHMIKGAKEHDFPEAYVAKLENLRL